MLSTLTNLKTAFGIALSDTTQDALLGLLLAGADGAIKRWCKRDLESTTYDPEFYSGTGRADLILRQRPVTSVISLYLDPTGYYGDAPGAFASSTLLVAGTDYVLKRDNGSQSDAGMVRKLGAGNTPGIFGGTYYPSGVRTGTLSGWDRGAIWPPGDGNIKVSFVAGYINIPSDLVQACNLLVAQTRAAINLGGRLMSEKYIDYEYQLLQSQKPELSEVRTLLAPYREVNF